MIPLSQVGLLTPEQILSALNGVAESVKTLNQPLSPQTVKLMVGDHLRHEVKLAKQAAKGAVKGAPSA